MEHPYKGGTNACINGPGHMTKMTAMDLNSENLLKSSPEKKTYDFETCHEASGNGALQGINHDPGMAFDLFHRKVNICRPHI